MCGIAGTVNVDHAASPIDRAELHRMSQQLAKRGPDGEGIWVSPDGQAALVHRRLAIIDLSDAGSQPMRCPATGNMIVFNGEIYNYKVLRNQLIAAGEKFVTSSDTEVLLRAYERYGTKMLGMLRGMFAFAIWNPVARTLFLARDPFGVKPLYYAETGGRFRFSSTVKGLLAGGAIAKRPEAAGHVGFYLWGSVPEPWTVYAGVYAVPAGHFMVVKVGGATGTQKYQGVGDMIEGAIEAPASGSRQAAIENIADAVRESVSAHLTSDVPVGSFLSAGLDSTLITALASKLGYPLQTLTLAFQEYVGTQNDESQIASQIAARWAANHRTSTVNRSDFQESARALLDAMDQPSIDGVNTWFVSRAAAANGMKVVLSGVGGDELFAGYALFRTIPRILKWTPPMGRGALLSIGWRRFFNRLLRPHFPRKGASLLEYGSNLQDAYYLMRSLYMHWELPELLDEHMLREGWERLDHWQQLEKSGAAGVTVRPGRGRVAQQAAMRLAISGLEYNWYMRNQLLRDADWAGMDHSVEIRTPFIDVTLLQAAAPWIAAHPDISKAEIVAHAVPELPQELLMRPKTGFNIPVGEWLMGARQGRGRDSSLHTWAKRVHESLSYS